MIAAAKHVQAWLETHGPIQGTATVLESRKRVRSVVEIFLSMGKSCLDINSNGTAYKHFVSEATNTLRLGKSCRVVNVLFDTRPRPESERASRLATQSLLKLVQQGFTQWVANSR